jgi:DNA mismatch repair protein MutL
VRIGGRRWRAPAFSPATVTFMGRIRILSDNVANKIAAGEVVERPASVVKELLENSLDAGATEVRIDTENAGRRLIRIQDDGHGMLRDDAMLAFERHATSKLSDVKDLLAIATLGFRGEALPSVASVSRMRLETRSADEQTGAAVEISGGKLLRCDEIVHPVGTTIAVRDLFYNVPARKKFLRSDQTELAHIGSLVTHYSLAHFDKRFELYHEGRELLHVTPVAEIRERAYQVFGSEIMDDLIDLGVRTKDLRLPPPYVPPNTRPTHVQAPDAPPPEPETAHYALRGLMSGPHVQKLNRNSIFLFVNGRLIRDRLILHALTAGYHNLMPLGCFPFALLFLDCDPGEVDVNVHPAKTEVRFRHGSLVHDFVRDTVREALIASRPVSSVPVMPKSPVPEPPSVVVAAPWGAPRRFEFPDQPIQQGAVLPFSEFSQALAAGGEDQLSSLATPGHFSETQASQLPEVSLPRTTFGTAAWSSQPSQPDENKPPAAFAAIRTGRVPDTHGGLSQLPAVWDQVDSYRQLPELRPLGQLHESFIIAAGRDGLWIIDQHVAHERILFEQVLRQRAAGRPEIQRLLMPLVLKLTPGQEFEYARIADELNACGFESEPFGQRTIAVKAAPAGVDAADIERVIFEILEIAEAELRGASLDDLRRGVSATIACRAAIKVNTRLESSKIDWLLQALSACEYPMTCPHGRPIALRYSTKDILRSFHRI